MNNPSIEDMIREHLHLHGYDGLCNPEMECGCGLGDLFPCGYPVLDECRAAYLHKTEGGYYTEKEGESDG